MLVGSTWVPELRPTAAKGKPPPEALPLRLEGAIRQVEESLCSFLLETFEEKVASLLDEFSAYGERRIADLEGMLSRVSAKVERQVAQRIEESFMPKVLSRLSGGLDSLVAEGLAKAASALNARAAYIDSYCDRWVAGVEDLDPDPEAPARSRTLARLEARAAALVGVLEQLAAILSAPGGPGDEPKDVSPAAISVLRALLATL